VSVPTPACAAAQRELDWTDALRKSAAPVCSCSRPIKDHAYLCHECTATVEKHLGDMPALAEDVETTRTRTSRTGGQGIGIVVRSAERPVPWDNRASRVADEIKAVLVSNSRMAADTRPPVEGPACRRCRHPSCALIRSVAEPDDTVEALSRYLLASLAAFRHRPEVTALADDLDRLTRLVAFVIDTPVEQTYYGPCGSIDVWPDGSPRLCVPRCSGDLYGDPDATAVNCQRCGASHDVPALREVLLDEAQEMLVTAPELSRFLSLYGEPITVDRIHQWASRGQIVSHGSIPSPGQRKPQPLYKVCEVRQLLARMDASARRAG
jgi:hypothetical protein